VMLQKRLPGEIPQGPAWKAVSEITNSLEEVISVNEYFAAHPEMMLGEMRLAGRMYQRGEPTLEGNGRDLTEQLKEAVTRLPVNVFHARQVQTVSTATEQSYPAPEEVKPNAYCIVQGNNQLGLTQIRCRCRNGRLVAHYHADMGWSGRAGCVFHRQYLEGATIEEVDALRGKDLP
jgi:hypothetical protein